MRSQAKSDGELLGSDRPRDFGEFYTRHQPALTRYVAGRLRGGELVFDVVAETFARAFEQRRQFDPARGVAIGWLIGIARNLIADAARRHRVAADARRRLALPVAWLDDDQIAAIDAHRDLDLRVLLGDLSAAQREAVLRRIVGEQGYDEIAAHIQCSEQVARQHVSRGLARIRKAVGESS